MNEWSPGRNYSCSGTPNQRGRPFLPQQDESGRGTKPFVLNMKAPKNRSRNFQLHSVEDVSKGLLSTSNKKGGNETSDPRFKRVVSLGVQNDGCIATEVRSRKPSLVSEVKGSSLPKFPVWNAPEFKPNKYSVKISDDSKLTKKYCCQPNCENATETEDSNVKDLQDHLKAVDKLSFNHDVVKSVCKESVSGCTLNTRNTSFLSEELPQEFSNTLVRIPSATRARKVETWIYDQEPRLEKKHSVITIIGQMQEPDILGSAPQEIDERRKLVTELDKYAVCKKIMEIDKERKISNLMSEIKYLNNNDVILINGSNETLNTNPNSTKGCGDKIRKHFDISYTEKTVSNCNDLSVASSIPVSVTNSAVKERLRNQSSIVCPIKELSQNNTMVFVLNLERK